MALEVADGTITITTGAVGTTFTVSGLSFQPKALKLFWSGRATNGQAREDHRFGAGFASSTTSRRAYSTQSDDGPTTSATDSVWSNDSCIITLTTAGAIEGKADLDAILSDGFRLIIDDQFATALQVGWKAWGGSDLTDVEIVDFTEPGATGDQDIATAFALDTGKDDKAIIFLGSSVAAANTPAVHSIWMLGAAAGDTISNAVLMGAAVDAQGTSVTFGYCRAGECVASTRAANAVASRASVTAWLSTGFRLNWAEVDAGNAPTFSALVMKGGRWQVGDALTSTGTSNQTEATAYVPKSLLVASHGKAASTLDTVQPGDERIVGVATSSTSRRYAAINDIDNVGNMVVGSAYDETQMYANQDDATPPVIEGLMDLVSFDATHGYTYVMDDADPVAAFFWYLLAADGPRASLPLLPNPMRALLVR